MFLSLLVPQTEYFEENKIYLSIQISNQHFKILYHVGSNQLTCSVEFNCFMFKITSQVVNYNFLFIIYILNSNHKLSLNMYVNYIIILH